MASITEIICKEADLRWTDEADGHIEGGNIICGVHGWDYRYDTGVSEYNNKEVLQKFTTLIEGDVLYVDLDEIEAFLKENPQSFNREAKIALAKGAEKAGTGIASGEGGMLPEEQENNSRYFYELASYIILDGRGGGTGAAPSILRNNINVPTIPALARARKHLDRTGNTDVTLIITGGLRIADDFVKALMLGADAVAISNSALQAIGCLGMRACHTNNCPVGIATQKENLRQRIVMESSAKQLANFLSSSGELMQVVARACGYENMNQFNPEDLVTSNHHMHLLTGIAYAGGKH